MIDPLAPPTFATLLQRFFTEHLIHHRAVSPRTVASYRDTFRLLLHFIEQHSGKAPTSVTLADVTEKLVLAFLDHLERGAARMSAVFYGSAFHAILTPGLRKGTMALSPQVSTGSGRTKAGMVRLTK